MNQPEFFEQKLLVFVAELAIDESGDLVQVLLFAGGFADFQQPVDDAIGNTERVGQYFPDHLQFFGMFIQVSFGAGDQDGRGGVSELDTVPVQLTTGAGFDVDVEELLEVHSLARFRSTKVPF